MTQKGQHQGAKSDINDCLVLFMVQCGSLVIRHALNISAVQGHENHNFSEEAKTLHSAGKQYLIVHVCVSRTVVRFGFLSGRDSEVTVFWLSQCGKASHRINVVPSMSVQTLEVIRILNCRP